MEVKIGVAESPREILVNSTQPPDEIESQVAEALRNKEGALALTDEKGRRVVVPSARIAYVEIGPADTRRVGFNVGS